MSEKENFDEKLANKFKEAFDDYEAAYNPADWTKLQSKLYKSPFTSVWRNRYATPIAVAAGVSLLFMSYFLLKEKTLIQQQENTLYIENKTVESSNGQAEKINKATEAETQKIAKTPTDRQSQQNDNEKNAVNSPNTLIITKNDGKQTEKQVKQQVEKQNIILDETQIQIAKNQASKNTTKLDKANLIGQNEQKAVANTTESSKLIIPVLPISAIQIDSLYLPYEKAKPNGNIDLALKSVIKQKNKKEFPLPITFGLALNSLLYKNAISQQHAIEAGLNVSMPFANRLRLTTGVLLAHQEMQYKKDSRTTKEILFVADTDSQMPVGIGSVPRKNIISTSEEMNNDLLIVNVPINLQYDFWQNSKTRLFASLGISNYVYLGEKSHYISKVIVVRDRYDDDKTGQPPFLPPHISQNVVNSEVSSTRKYDALSKIDFLGGINASIGIEYQLSNRFSVQAAPFIRLPIKSIGHDGLTFDTFGMSVVVNYR